MGRNSIRVLVADDFASWRHFFSTTIQKQGELKVIGQAADGLEAVHQAQELQPDLILLDIGLPTLNGIEAARQIQNVSPASKILFVSENRSADIAKEALSTGAGGYIVKSDAGSELLPAVKAVLEGKRFVSASVAGLNGPPHPQTGAHFPRDNNVGTLIPQNVGSSRHEVAFYSDDRHLLDDVTQFIGTALSAGNAAVVVATKSHLESLLLEFEACRLEIGEAIQRGRYIALDAAETIETFIIDDMVDSRRFLDGFGNLIKNATKSATRKNPRVAFFGEGTDLLVAQGKVEAAIQDEKLCNLLMKIYDVDILCGYSQDRVEGRKNSHNSQQICEQHSAVYSR